MTVDFVTLLPAAFANIFHGCAFRCLWIRLVFLSSPEERFTQLLKSVRPELRGLVLLCALLLCQPLRSVLQESWSGPTSWHLDVLACTSAGGFRIIPLMLVAVMTRSDHAGKVCQRFLVIAASHL